MRLPILAAVVSVSALAQPPVAPSTETVGRARGENHGNYNIVHSYELGVRWHEVHGDRSLYRSDVNFGNGVRLLGSSFSMNSKDGHGAFVDELTVHTQGLAGDPYQFASARATKGNLFRYEMIWRQNEYFNPASTMADGLHRMDTARRIQDHELTLFPRARFRIFAGYSRVAQDGMALTTAWIFDPTADAVPLFADVRRMQREYRIGNEFTLLGFKLHWIRAWERFEERTPLTLPTPFTTPDGTTATSYRRAEPWQGSTPSWRVNLLRESSTRWAINGRFTHSDGDRSYVLDESTAGAQRFGPALNRQVLVSGVARRPVVTAHLTLSLFPTRRLAVTNHTGFHNTRMEGDSTYTEVQNADLAFASIQFQSLGIRNVTNATDANYRAAKWLQLRAGYQFAERAIRSTERTSVFAFEDLVRSRQTNRLHAGVAGFRLQPLKPLTIAFDGEVGRQDRAFYPVSDKDYHALNGRIQWRKKSVTLGAQARTFYNFNSASLAVHSARGRTYNADASWSPLAWFSIDAAYSKLHTDTTTALSYFVTFQPVGGERSIWISNLHAGHLGSTLSIRRRVDLYLGYSRTQDTGDGRSIPATPAGRPGSATPEFRAAQTFPMLFESPQARVSVRIHEKLRWNAGYQFYRYREDFSALQRYRAHTGFTSLLWTF